VGWKLNGEAIYATKASPLQPLSWGRCTLKPNGKNTTLYFSVFNWPSDGKLLIPGLKNEVVSAKMLAGNTALKATTSGDGIVINVPDKATDGIATVIKVEVKGTIGAQNANPAVKMKTGALD
jgi:alpha-L-fucosidase